ncbi:hypothetical protein PC110_g8614 [Phytophthora cactorum]|uniref:Uncharacterized protein n=1 Tax=Phytophthora cactorum TaxID=29920 RepID=A0A329SES3_9STRA|nr:hypothetical protein PC110_g8614 [Phytophthora cactorum]
MVHRYLKLLEHLDPTDDDIVDVLPAPACNKSLLSLLKDLKKVESVSKALQRFIDLVRTSCTAPTLSRGAYVFLEGATG